MSDTERLVHDPHMPQGDILLEVFARVTDMSDALHSPHGLLQVRLKEYDDKQFKRHLLQMGMLRKILDEVLSIKRRLDTAEENIEQQGTEITLLKPQLISEFTEVQ